MSSAKKIRVLAWPALGPRDSNPYCSLLYGNLQQLGVEVDDFRFRRAIFGKYDIWHLHWPDHYLNQETVIRTFIGTNLVLMCLMWGRIRNTKILWTVHNLASHSRRHPGFERYFWQLFTRLLDGFISLSSAGVSQARCRFQHLKSLPGFVVPHGHYRTSYPDNIGRVEARKALAIPPASPLFLFLGAISPYKNVLNLITVFRQSEEQSWRLCIAGQLSPQIPLNKLNEAIGEDPRVLLHIGWVPTEKVQVYFRAADLVVLPFQEIFNSGSALLALSLGRPVLTSAKGALPELQSTVGREWISIYKEELKTAHLAEGMAWALQTDRGAEAPLSSFEWPALAQMTLDAYQAVLKPAAKERELHGLYT